MVSAATVTCGVTRIIEKDLLGKPVREVMSRDDDALSETIYIYSDALAAGFNVAAGTKSRDVRTGLEVAATRLLDFNTFGGATFEETYPVEGVKRIRVFGRQGRVAELYEGRAERVAYHGGTMTADTITVFKYDNSFFRARNIASVSERYDYTTGMKGGLITTSEAQELTEVETRYGYSRP